LVFLDEIERPLDQRHHVLGLVERLAHRDLAELVVDFVQLFLFTLVSLGLVSKSLRRNRSFSMSGGRAVSSPNRSLVRRPRFRFRHLAFETGFILPESQVSEH
jgi:hypothetical protein